MDIIYSDYNNKWHISVESIIFSRKISKKRLMLCLLTSNQAFGVSNQQDSSLSA